MPAGCQAGGVSRAAAVPQALRGRVFRGTDAVRRGLATRRQLQSTAFRRLFRDVYADASVPLDHTLRCRGAALLVPPGAAISGWSAAHLYGATLLTGDHSVYVVTPPSGRFGPVDRLDIAVSPLLGGDIRPERPVATAVRTAWDVARSADVERAVVTLDLLVRCGALRSWDLPAVLAGRAGWRGHRRATATLALVDGRAESPQESRLRLRLTLAGSPPPESQYEVRDAAGAFVGRVDFAWPARRIALEYDGAWHGGAEQLRHDRRRLNRLQGAGWLVLHVTADRLRADFPGLLAEIRGVLARRPAS
jgi:hypothetical protein